MKRIVLFLLIGSLIISCSTTKRVSREKKEDKVTVSAENDGSSYENAIVINEKSESAGVPAEYSWLRENYPGCMAKGQSLIFYNNKPYDIITIITADGVEKEVYFDISKFYGKFR
jgi:predicted Zn-dependent protease